MSEHTPGPWTATDNTHLNGAWWIEFDSFCSIAEVRNGADDGWDGKPYPGTPEANARLIAAAPTLLAAVERARRHAENIGITDGSYIAELDAALALAKAPPHAPR